MGEPFLFGLSLHLGLYSARHTLGLQYLPLNDKTDSPLRIPLWRNADIS